jgi:hypothetical protein
MGNSFIRDVTGRTWRSIHIATPRLFADDPDWRDSLEEEAVVRPFEGKFTDF